MGVKSNFAWRSFLFGLSSGIAATALTVWLFGSRYRVAMNTEGWTVKVDTWTGRSWVAGYPSWRWRAIEEPSKLAQ